MEVEVQLTGSFRSIFITGPEGDGEQIKAKSGPDQAADLMKCIEEGAEKVGFPARDFLKKTKFVKLRVPEFISDTLRKREGARIGLIVSKGHERKVYFEGKGRNPVLDCNVADEMIVGIEEEIDDSGEQIVEPREEEVRDKVRHLLEYGSGIIAVSLKNAALNPANERSVKGIVKFDYPRHYLGAVPVLLSSEFSGERDEFLRTSVCLLNAYIWFSLNHFLRHIETLLQQNGYNHSLLVAQADGSVVPIAKVTPLKTSALDENALVKKYVDELTKHHN